MFPVVYSRFTSPLEIHILRNWTRDAFMHDVAVFKYDQKTTTFCCITIDGTLFLYMPPPLGVLAALEESPAANIMRRQLLVERKPLDVIAVDSPNMYGNHERRLVVCSSSSRDRLFMVERKPQCSWEVFELDFYSRSWVRLSKLEGLVVFLGPRYSAVYKHRPNSGLVGNCICFTEDGDDAYFYVFSLADQSTSIFRNQPHSATGGFPVSFPNMLERPSWLRYLYAELWLADDEFKYIFRYQPHSAKVHIWSPKMQDHLRMPWLSFTKEDAQKNTISEEPAKDVKACEIRTLDPEESCNAHASFYCELPDNVLRFVAKSLLSAMDYANYRLVCRKLRETVQPLCWKPEFSNTPSMESPWLMSFHEEDGPCTSFLDLSCNMRYFKRNLELSGCKVCCCRNGWLLVTHGIRTIFFFEPLSKTKINIPDLPANISFSCISFSSSPTSSDWLIIAIAPRPGILKLGYITSGVNEWKFARYQGENLTFLCYGCNQVLHRNRFYYLCQNGSLAYYRRQSRRHVIKQRISGSIESLSNYRKGYLVSCKNDLYLVVIGPHGKFVNLYKSDPGHTKWKEEKVLPRNYSFFISQVSSFAVRVNAKAKQNTINLPLLVKNRHVYYKLDTSEFTCDGDNSSSMELHERKEFVSSIWLPPKVTRA